MPIKCTYNKQENYLECIVDGELTIDIFKRTLNSLMTSDEHPPDVDTLWDLRNFDFANVDADTQRQWVELRSKQPKRGNARMAMLVNDDVNFGKSRMYEMWSGGLPQRMRAFRDYDEAKTWFLSDKDN